jgi:hypothetical protein
MTAAVYPSVFGFDELFPFFFQESHGALVD